MAWTDEPILFLVPWHRAAEVGADGAENTKLASLIFCNVNRLFRHRFAPAIHLFNLNGTQHRFIQSRKLIQRSYWGTLQFRRPTQYRKEREARERHAEQGTYKGRANAEERAEKRARLLKRHSRSLSDLF
jgi:hypothetical protein